MVTVAPSGERALPRGLTLLGVYLENGKAGRAEFSVDGLRLED